MALNLLVMICPVIRAIFILILMATDEVNPGASVGSSASILSSSILKGWPVAAANRLFKMIRQLPKRTVAFVGILTFLAYIATTTSDYNALVLILGFACCC